MRVLLADDHALFRAGFRLVLHGLLGEATEVLEAADFPETVNVLRTTDKVDLVFCDLYMGDVDRFVGLTNVIRYSGGAPVIVLSASEQAQDVRYSIRAGARAYVFKHEDLEVLRHVVELVIAGRVYAPVEALGAAPPPSILARGGEDGLSAIQPMIADLSDRQRMIVSLLGKGLSNKEIARALSIAEGTVKSQLRAIYRRLGVRNRTEAALLLNRPRERAKSNRPSDPLEVVRA